MLERKKKKRTLPQLTELWGRIMDRADEGMGYQPYGWDWPTLGVVRPLLCAALKQVFRESNVPVVVRS